MSNGGLTVKELKIFCDSAIRRGLGGKHILISNDDEGNGYHTLLYQFTTDLEEIERCANEGMFHDNNDPSQVVLLG